jgi:hypothetical protein
VSELPPCAAGAHPSVRTRFNGIAAAVRSLMLRDRGPRTTTSRLVSARERLSGRDESSGNRVGLHALSSSVGAQCGSG